MKFRVDVVFADADSVVVKIGHLDLVNDVVTFVGFLNFSMDEWKEFLKSYRDGIKIELTENPLDSIIDEPDINRFESLVKHYSESDSRRERKLASALGKAVNWIKSTPQYTFSKK